MASLALSFAADGQTPESGQLLIQKLGCPVCHDIPGHTTTVRQEAPDLTYEGDRVKPEWLFEFLRSPVTIRPGVAARMPNFRLTDTEALALTEALGSFKDRKAPPLPPGQRYQGTLSPVARAAAVKLLTKDYFDCFNCHWDGDKKPGGKPEEWAPDLGRVANRLNPDWIVRWLIDPAKIVPGTKMPAFFPDDKSGPDDILGGDETAQILTLRDYLMAGGQAASGGSAYARVKAEHADGSVAPGRSLLLRLNCVGCHRIAGFPEGKRVGPPLGFQGSRVTREWLREFLRRPGPIKPEYAIMGSDARMPDFRLTDGEVDTLTDYFMSRLRDANLPALPATALDPKLAPDGERLFSEKFCDNCHRIGSRPGGIGPDLTFAGRRLNPAWIYRFVLNPSHYLDTRMPNLQLTESEARAVTAYLLNLERLP
ncbi:MAG: c-type cytochrome [Candidatus Rokubacteria bacterium]|nr:c-type cytochrome [Candidatus Rokubacteria bacterium]